MSSAESKASGVPDRVADGGASQAMSAADRTPPLEKVLRREDLERCVRPFLGLGLDAIAVFDLAGAPHAIVDGGDSALRGWGLLAPEAVAAEREAERGSDAQFGLVGHRYAVRPAYAGADRVGTFIFGVAEDDQNAERLATLANALHGVLASMLQSGFATWVTSELHLASSESSYRALEQQNAELQRAVNHLRELDQLKSNFLATVSHELRTPLTSVIGFADMLLKGIAGDLNEEQSEYVKTILERGEDLYKLITQILEMSRMETGAVRLALEACSVSAVAERALSSVTIAAKNAEVSCRQALPADLPPALVDADKIQQVLVNLVSNAIKFNRAGGEVVIEAALAPIKRPFDEEDFFGSEADDAIRVAVRDTGVGIPADQLGRIFEAFYQVDASSTREHGGAGLGLSIVQKIVEAHGGDVWAESTVGEGTTFFFTVPRGDLGG